MYGNVPGYDIETEYAIIKNTLLEEKRETQEYEGRGLRNVIRSYMECLKRENIRRTIGAATPICAEQLTGLSFLSTYASLFFRQSGFDDAFLITTIMCKSSRLSSMSRKLIHYVGCIALVASVCLMVATDKIGRRNIVFVASIVCTIAMLVIGILGLVPKTPALNNFLIFIACLWSFCSNARKC